ncbi:cell division ATP-binding protein FtsE [Alkalibaculum bacchi]|uniref:Cell division ATP-binding protein FtsE n=1 Tax=Alkalibaculum bacchi TaxID=645887 RepID=A0A366IDJ8_9FIRM|nr:cell division ATP-binding protein FtsE [Alkalibaculum bacchi]RBP69065.1 cell division ATP-binding protein FtsE [Alkalibaculum bacchi]
MIELKDVSVTYDKTKHLALSDVNLEIGTGEFVFVVGKSGAGKSTFIKLLLKELEPSLGQIKIDSRNITQMKKRDIPYYRRKLGIVFQDFRLLSEKTVYGNVAFAMEIVEKSPSEIKDRVNEVLELVGLSHRADYFPDQLSGGEQQRVGIARAIVNKPDFIICDEPTGNLDPNTSKDIMNILENINNQDTTIIMATHDKEIVNYMQKRVIALSGGKIIKDGRGGYPNED